MDNETEKTEDNSKRIDELFERIAKLEEKLSNKEKKLEEYANNSKVWLWGKVFILNSEKFGKHIFLVSQFPGKTYEEKTKFIDLKSSVASTIYYSSVMNDEVLEVFDSLTEYIKWEYN